MKYKGQELEPITKPQIFDPPKEMLVWDTENDKPEKQMVWCIAPPAIYQIFPVLGKEGSYKHCAEIPEAIKLKRATNLQLMEWLARGNGMWKRKNDSSVNAHSCFFEDSLEKEVEDFILIRPFGTTEWIEPTLENMGIEE